MSFIKKLRRRLASGNDQSRLVSSPVAEPSLASGGAKSATYAHLESLMGRYQLKDLVSLEPDVFRRRIDAFLALTDHAMEGFDSAEHQRDLTIRFHWGHDHDFGEFALAGRMGKRHLALLTTFIDEFGTPPRSLEGCRVLDIGCWTGGTSLLMAAMGAEVYAIEEVQKYVECLQFLKEAFAVDRLQVRPLSLYDCTAPELQDAFDYVLFAGVLYHVTDLVMALRITFNCLKDGGTCLMETMGLDSEKQILEYQGPDVVTKGSKEALNRGGWNWYLPSPSTIGKMMEDVGYTAVQVSGVLTNKRVFAVGKREAHRPMMRSGVALAKVR